MVKMESVSGQRWLDNSHIDVILISKLILIFFIAALNFINNCHNSIEEVDGEDDHASDHSSYHSSASQTHIDQGNLLKGIDNKAVRG